VDLLGAWTCTVAEVVGHQKGSQGGSANNLGFKPVPHGSPSPAGFADNGETGGHRTEGSRVTLRG
jgi:hypothetical protein